MHSIVYFFAFWIVWPSFSRVYVIVNWIFEMTLFMAHKNANQFTYFVCPLYSWHDLSVVWMRFDETIIRLKEFWMSVPNECARSSERVLFVYTSNFMFANVRVHILWQMHVCYVEIWRQNTLRQGISTRHMWRKKRSRYIVYMCVLIMKIDHNNESTWSLLDRKDH